MYLHGFVWNLRDYAKAIAAVPPDDFNWARQIYTKIYELVHRKDGKESVHTSIDPIRGPNEEEWWAYCIRHSYESNGAVLTTHFDVEETSSATANVCVTLQLSDEPYERGMFRLYTRKRQFHLYWYGQASGASGAKCHPAERRLISFVQCIEERACTGFHGEIRLGKKRAYRIIREFVNHLHHLTVS